MPIYKHNNDIYEIPDSLSNRFIKEHEGAEDITGTYSETPEQQQTDDTEQRTRPETFTAQQRSYLEGLSNNDKKVRRRTSDGVYNIPASLIPIFDAEQREKEDATKEWRYERMPDEEFEKQYREATTERNNYKDISESMPTMGGMTSPFAKVTNRVKKPKSSYTDEEYSSMKEEKDRRSFYKSKKETYDAIVNVKKNEVEIDIIEEKSGEDNNTRAARNLNDRTMLLGAAGSKYDTNSGLKNFSSGFGRGLSDEGTWSFGIADLAVLKQVIDASSKPQEQWTASEKTLIDSYVNNILMSEARAEDLSIGYQAGQSTAQSIPFMAEMLITAGVGSAVKNAIIRAAIKKGGEAAGKKLMRIFGTEIYRETVKDSAGKAIKDVSGNKIKSTLRNEAKDNVAKKVARELVEENLQTIAMPMSWTNIRQDKANELVIGDGDYSFLDFARSYTNAWAEVFTERAGGKMIDNALRGVLPIDRIWGKRIGGIFSDYVQSPIGETGEEYLNGVLDIIRSFNPLYSGEDNKNLREQGTDMFTAEGFSTTALAVAPMSLVFGTANARKHADYTRKYKGARGEMLDAIVNAGATNEEAEKIINDIEKSNGDLDFTNKMADLLNSMNVKHLNEYPNEDEKTGKEYANNLDKVFKKYFNAAAQYNASIETLNSDYEKMTDEQKIAFDQAYNSWAEERKMKADILIDIKKTFNITEEEIDKILQKEEDLTDKDREILSYMNEQKDRYNDFITQNRRKNAISARVSLANRKIDEVTNADMDAVVSVTLQDGQHVAITKGRIIQNDDGGIDEQQSDKELMYIDDSGNTQIVTPKNIKSVDAVNSPDKLKQDEKQNISARVDKNIANGKVRSYDVGESIRFNSQIGTLAGMIYGIDPTSGAYIVNTSIGRANVEPSDIINEDNMLGIEEGSVVSYREGEDVNTGVIQFDQELHSQGNVYVDDKIVPIADILPIRQDEQDKQEKQSEPEKDIANDTSSEKAPEEQPSEADVFFTNFKERHGDKSFAKAEKTIADINEKTAKKQQEIDKLQQQLDYMPDAYDDATAKAQANIDGKIQSLRQDIEALGGTMSKYKDVQQRLYQENSEAFEKQRAEAAEAEKRRAEAEAAEQERARKDAEVLAAQQAENVPDVANDTEKAARERGYRLSNGVKIERQEQVPALIGKDKKIKFGKDKKDIAAGHNAVVEADTLQPSHVHGQVNYATFIRGTQPKDRRDAVSQTEADKIASNINSPEITGGETAYTGSPTANTRGEVIQGHNRTEALKRMYDQHPEQAAIYKQYLIDHAAEFGLNAEEISAMEKPILINMVDVTDEEAIRLGQKSAADTETGGMQRIPALQTATALGDDIASFGRILIGESEEDGGLLDSVAANGIDALKYLHQKGIINDTQYQSAFDKKGNLTAEAKQDMINVLKHILFNGANDNIETMFSSLPASAQKAILQSVYRDLKSSKEASIIPDLQQAIEVYYYANQSEPVREAKGQQARGEITSWSLQYQMDFSQGNFVPVERYSNFAIELAIRFKTDTQKTLRETLNLLYDKLQGVGGDMFTPAEKLGKAEAINKIFNIQYNGLQRNNVVANNNGNGRTGQSASAGDTASGEQNQSGKGTANSGTGNQRDDREGQSDVKETIGNKLEAAEAETNTTPTEAQKEAGNYKKGHVQVGTFDITIENPKGSERSGTDVNGKKWSVSMNNTYGYIRGTEGVDGDHIDVFLSDDIDGWNGDKVFVVDQHNEDDTFDEHKVMLGFNDAEEAEGAYYANYSPDWKDKHPANKITAVNIEDFEKWIASSHRKTKPFSEYKNVKSAPASTDAQEESTSHITATPTEEQSMRDKRTIAEKVAARIGAKIKLVDSVEEIPSEERKAIAAIRSGERVLGWHNVDTGKTYLYVPNVRGISDVERTILHEAIAHRGLRELLGEEAFDNLCDEVFKDMTANQRRKYLEYVTQENLDKAMDYAAAVANKKNTRAAADEYMATIAEDGVDNPTLWNKICRIIGDVLRKLGFTTIKKQDIAYYLYLSKQLQKGIAPDAKEILDIQAKLAMEAANIKDSINKTDGIADAAKPAPKPKIGDVGEKIGGARKDVIRKYADKINLDATTFGKLFPKPDVRELINNGLSVDNAAAVKAMYDLAKDDYAKTKRRKGNSAALRACIFYAKYAKQALDGNHDLNMSYNGIVFTDWGKELIAINTKAYQALYKKLGVEYADLDLSKFLIYPTNKKANDVKYTIGYSWSVKDQVKTEEEAINAFIKKVQKGTTFDVPKYEYSLYYKRDERGRVDYSKVYVGFKLRGFGTVDLKEFSNSNEATEWIKNNRADADQMAATKEEELKKTEDKKSKVNLKTEIQKNERIGKDYRHGRDISAEELKDTFNFRAIEFGNYATQKERQEFLNRMYDSLMDFAEILGVSPDALSFNGKLAIAYGARGTGSAMGHYEREKNVINITKTSGSGVFAHEWMHALDTYFSGAGSYATAGKYADDTREEMKKAFDNIIEKIKETDYYKRSLLLDNYRQGYWSKNTELAARALQDYVIRKMEAQGAKNTFLSNHISPEEWNGRSETYPFPIGEDVAKIDKALDNLFETIQERVDAETGNKVLFRRLDNTPQTGGLRQEVEERSTAVYKSQEQLLNAVFEQLNIPIRLSSDNDSNVRFRTINVTQNDGRNRNADREAFKKAFKTGGEQAYDLLYENQGGTIAKYPMEFLNFLKEKIGVSDNLVDIVKNNHDWLVIAFQKANPALFKQEEKTKTVVPDVNDVLKKSGYTFLEHTMDNGKALGVKCMYRDKFIKSGKTNKNHTPTSRYHSLSVICYYNDPDSRLSSQYVFTVESHNADTTPTAYELVENPKLMTPEWEAYLEKAGRKNEDGTFDLKGLKPNFNDPFSLSFLMIRMNKKGSHGLEVISRYNHYAFNADNELVGISGQPNNTLGLDIDKLVKGFRQSLFAYKNISVGEKEILLSNNVRMANDGKLYDTVYEKDGFYFGDGFYIDRENNARVIDRNKEVLAGSILFSNGKAVEVIREKELGFLHIHKMQISGGNVTFYTGGEEVVEHREITMPDGSIKKVEKKKWTNDKKTEIKTGKETSIYTETDSLSSIEELVETTRTQKLILPNLTSVGDGFLSYNESLTTLELPNLTSVGNNFLYYNNSLTTLELPNLTSVGDGFLSYNESLTTLELPNLTSVGNNFLFYNRNSLTTLELPNLTSVGNGFLYNNNSLTTLELPNLTSVGNGFLSYNRNSLTTLELPNLTSVGDGFLSYNESLTTLELPNLTSVGNNFLYNNNSLTTLELPNLTSVGDGFLSYNESLTTLELPNLTSVGNNFLYNRNSLTTLELPNLTSVGNNFLYYNNSLTTLELPNLTSVGNGFLSYNESLTTLELPNLTSVGNNFLFYNNSLRENVLSEIDNRKKENDVTRFRITPEMESIKSQAIKDGTFMKAPNGNATKLAEKQWLQVRTKAFKKWFGDWELAATEIEKVAGKTAHGFKNFDEALQWAKDNITRTLTNEETGGKGEIRISNTAIEKYLSEKAVKKSDSKDVHLSALKVLPQIIKQSIVGETHADRDGNEHIKDIQRLFGCLTIDGKDYRVKTTIKRYNDKNEKSKAYSYEVTEIELLEGVSGTTQASSASSVPTTSNSITAAKLLNGVEKSYEKGKYLLDSSKVVDANGEPMVVYHHSTRRFTKFSRERARTNMEMDGFFFSPINDPYNEYGENVIPAFLNIKNPFYNPTFDRSETDAGKNKRLSLQSEGYDGAIRQEYDEFDVSKVNDEEAFTEYVAFEPNQIKSAEPVTYDDNGDVIPLSERFNQEKEDIRFRFIGERGAAALDKAQEATTRLDNLRKAREMENGKSDAKAIKLATGWERGADGKWRYETDDMELVYKPAIKSDSNYKRELFTDKLENIIEYDELFAAYPSLRNLEVQVVGGLGNKGSYNYKSKGIEGDADGVIMINNNYSDIERFKTLIHEIQHAIQHIEGFASGTEQSKAAVDTYYDKIKPDFTINEERVIDWYKDYKKDSTINNPYWEQGISTDEYLSLNKKLIDKYEGYLQKVKELEGKDGIDIYSWYKRNAGEVEARNASYRMNMTTEERRNSLAAETEDVAREDQIILMDGLGMSESRGKDEERAKTNHIIDAATAFVTGKSENKVRKERQQREQNRRDEAKEIYDKVLQGEFNDVTLQQINKYIDEFTPNNPYGRHISQRLPQKVERRLRERERTNSVDALFSRISESAVEAVGGTVFQKRKAAAEVKNRLLEGWAKASGHWFEDTSSLVNDSTPIGSGTDSVVYLSKDGNGVIKLSKGKRNRKYESDIDAANLFNGVFYNSQYDIIGYSEKDGNLITILSQPVIDFTDSKDVSEKERVDFMRSLGFEPRNKENTLFSNGTLIVSDLQKANIVRDSKGNIRVIDADVKLHTKDIGGDYSYPDVSVDTEDRLGRRGNGTRFRKDFQDRMTPDELYESLDEISVMSNGAYLIVSQIESYYGGEIISASSGARNAVKRGLIPMGGNKFSGEDEEYHHFLFKNQEGNEFVEEVPFFTADDVNSYSDIRFRVREQDPPKKTGTGYKVFVLKNGGLYPPMVANPNGEATPIGVWLDADAAPIAGQSKTGRNQVKSGGKGTQGGSGKLAYRPGWHLGEIPYAIQFNRNNENGNKELFPANFVWAEVEYADDVDYQKEAMSHGMNPSGKFQHSLAGLPSVPENGSYRYRTNPNPETDPWIISGAMRVNRLLTPTEVDVMVEKAGREPQRRQEGAITDAQINALNKKHNATEAQDKSTDGPGDNIRFRKGEYKTADGVELSYRRLDLFADSKQADDKSIQYDVLGSRLRPLEEGEMCLVERIFTKDNNFNFMAGEKIESPEDVAYIFKNLEDSSIENTFAVLVKDGKPIVIHVGMGAQSYSPIDATPMSVLAKRVNPDKVYFVHNHPSGSIIASDADQMAWKRMNKLFGDKLQDGIIINTTSGNYGTFNGNKSLESVEENRKGGETNIPVYKFDKSVFSPDYNVSSRDRLESHEKVAKFVSSHRLGERKKLSLLVVDNGLRITGNVFLPYTEITRNNQDELASDIIYYTAALNGTGAFLYGNAPIEYGHVEGLSDKVKASGINLYDIIQTINGYNLSFQNNDLRFRRQNSVDSISEIGGNDLSAQVRDDIDRKLRSKLSKGFLGRWGNPSEYREAYQDGQLPVKKFLDVLRDKGIEVSENNDWYMKFTALAGKNQAQLDAYEKAYHNNILTTMNEIIQKGVSYRDIENYIMSKHGLERNDYMSKTNKDDKTKDYSGLGAIVKETGKSSEQLIDDFERKIGGPLTGKLWYAINQATNNALLMQYEAGLISKDVYEEIVGRYNYYIPLRGHDEETAEDVYDYGVNMGTYFASPIIKARGRKSRAEAPIAYIYQMNQSAIMQSNKNTLNKAILRLARIAQSKGMNVMTLSRTWYAQTVDETGKTVWTISVPEYAEDPAKYAKNVDEHEKRMKELEEKGMATTKRSKLQIDKFIKPSQGLQHEVNVYEGGKQYTIYIGANPRVARAISGANLDEAGDLFVAIGNLQRWMAANFTTRNPLFIASNFQRDLAYSCSTLAATESAGYNANYYKNLALCQGALSRYFFGKIDIKKNPMDRYISEFIMNGGKTGYSHIVELQKMKILIERAVRKKASTIQGKNMLIEAFGSANDFVENLTRFAAYITSREEGRSIARSVYDAKDLTVNFNRKGSGAMGAAEMRNMILFMNVAFQGLENILRRFAEHPIRMSAMALSYATMPIMMSALAYAIGGDDGLDDYWNLSDWDRHNRLCINTGNGFIKWHLPQELRVFNTMSDIAIQMYSGKKTIGTGLLEMLTAATDLLPVNPMGAVSNLSEVIPGDALRPFYQLAANKNFMGYPIYNEWKNGDMYKDDPGYTKARTNKEGDPFTPDIIIDISRWLDEITGKEAERGIKKGLISPNPDVVHHLIRGYFGGTYTIAVQSINSVYKAMEGKDVTARDLPISRFYTSKSDINENQSMLNEIYYKVVDEKERTSHQINNADKYRKQATKDNNVDEAVRYSRIREDLDTYKYRVEKDLISKIEKMEKQLKDLDDEQKSAVKSEIKRLKEIVVSVDHANSDKDIYDSIHGKR